MGWWRLIVFAESARCRRRRRILFLLSLENPYSDYFQDGHQNPMSLSRAWIALWICFMFGLKERPYPAHVLIIFWCDSDNKSFDFFTF